MSKPVYEIPISGDEGPVTGFPPPARDARPTNIATAPPPSPTGHAPTYPTEPSAPFTSPPPTLTPEGNHLPAPAAVPELPATPGLTLPTTPGLTLPPELPSVFPAPMPETAWAAPTAPGLASADTANFPPPVVPAPAAAPPAAAPQAAPVATAAPEAPAPQFAAPSPAEDLSYPAPEADLNFPPPGDSLSYAEQMFAMDGVSSTLAVADPDLIAALSEVLFLNASDLHVAVNTPPMFRVDGTLAPRSVTTSWGRDKVTSALRSILTESQAARFDEELELDIAYTISANARFRVNMYQQRGAIGAAFRLIPTEIKSLVDLGVPETVSQFATLPRGLVLVTGPTGSGKSTTLAALIDLVNKTRADHIMTVEDPIEFMHGNQKSLVNQR
ncbi:MAG TPA: ATPase, T2SS/T4P/T4SS family, partial [Galbitalea sp.]